MPVHARLHPKIITLDEPKYVSIPVLVARCALHFPDRNFVQQSLADGFA
jgi:hypothetical protein